MVPPLNRADGESFATANNRSQVQHIGARGAKIASPPSSRRDAPVTSHQVIVLVKVLMRPHVKGRVKLPEQRVHFVNEQAQRAVPSGTQGIGRFSGVRNPTDKHAGPVAQDPPGPGGPREVKGPTWS